VSLPETEQQRLAQQAMSLQWSVRELEQVVRQLAQPKPAAELSQNNQASVQTEQWQAWQQQLSEHLGVPVKLSVKANGKGKLEISFGDESALKKLIEKMSS
jgi:ParB family chromosome partitioning protein